MQDCVEQGGGGRSAGVWLEEVRRRRGKWEEGWRDGGRAGGVQEGGEGGRSAGGGEGGRGMEGDNDYQYMYIFMEEM